MPYITSVTAMVDIASQVATGNHTPLQSDAPMSAPTSTLKPSAHSASEDKKRDENSVTKVRQYVAECLENRSHDGSEVGEIKSQPPSPPESGTNTPRLRIAPCPVRLSSLIPPPNYGTVEHNQIYRSSFPQDRNMDFVKSLHIRSVLCLVGSEATAGYTEWTSAISITRRAIDIAPNKDGRISTTTSSICEALLYLLDRENQPLYIHCNQGRHRTGCVIACLRKVQRWPLDAIIAEYIAYASPKARPGDIALIEAFDPNLVFDHAKANGYLDGPTPRLRRLDSGITNIDALAAALDSVPTKDVAARPMMVDTNAFGLLSESVMSDDGLMMNCAGRGQGSTSKDGDTDAMDVTWDKAI